LLQNAEMDWDNEQICHWLTAWGNMFRCLEVKLGITGKESSAFGSFASPFGERKGGSSMAQSKGCVLYYRFDQFIIRISPSFTQHIIRKIKGDNLA
jgi:hypothetical protein